MRIGWSGIYFFALFTMAGTNVLKRALDLKHTKANQLNKERPIGLTHKVANIFGGIKHIEHYFTLFNSQVFKFDV